MFQNRIKRKILLECAIDDMTGEELGFLTEMLFSAGALDVYTSPIYEKAKTGESRFLCLRKQRERENAAMLFQTQQQHRDKRNRCFKARVKREVETADTNFGKVRIKKASATAPERKWEYEDLKNSDRTESIA